jgi:hypothetical protein
MNKGAAGISLGHVSNRLVKLIQEHAAELADKWLKDIRASAKTPTYHEFADKKLYTRAVEVYSTLEKWIADEADDKEIVEQYVTHGAERSAQGFKLSEVIQALILMRHHLWQKVLNDGLLDNTLDYYHATELYRKVVRYFDRAIFYTIVGYEGEILK